MIFSDVIIAIWSIAPSFVKSTEITSPVDNKSCVTPHIILLYCLFLDIEIYLIYSSHLFLFEQGNKK